MQNNTNTINTDDASNFNNVESVESVYPEEAIDIVDCISAQVISNDVITPDADQVAANEEYAPGEIYSLDNARLAKQFRSIERRACKSRLTDRRSVARVTANGEVQQDRRAANRIANVQSIRVANAKEGSC